MPGRVDGSPLFIAPSTVHQRMAWCNITRPGMKEQLCSGEDCPVGTWWFKIHPQMGWNSGDGKLESKYSRASGRWWASYLNNVDYLSPCQKVGSNFSSLVAYTFWHNKLCGTIWSASIRCLLFLGSRTPIMWPACIARYEGKHMAPRGVSLAGARYAS